MKRKMKSGMKKVAVLVLIIAVWQLIYYIATGVMKVWKPYMFPNPLGVLRVFAKLSGNGSIWIAILASFRRVLIGFLVSVLIGGLLGMLIYRVKFLNSILKPVFLGLQTLPSICWLPFAILWFGLNERAIIFVIVVGSAFSIAIAMEAGLRSVSPLYIRAGRTMGASHLQLFWSIIIPAGLPHILTGLKQGWSFSWRALMNGEMLSATKGLGQILTLGRDLSDINQVMCVMVIIMLLGIAVDRFVFGAAEGNMRKKRGML